MSTTSTGFAAQLAFLLLATSFRSAHAAVYCYTITTGYQGIVFTSANRTEAVQVESPPGYNANTGQYYTNKNICYGVRYNSLILNNIPLEAGESVAMRAEMRIELDRSWDGYAPNCFDTLQVTYTDMLGSTNSTRYCKTPWYTNIIASSAGISARYLSDSTEQGGNGYRVTFSPVIIPSNGSKATEIANEFSGCTPIALTSADVDFVWASSNYPKAVPTAEECWAFYMESNINETQYFIQIQLLTLNGGSDSMLYAFDASNRSLTNKLFANEAGDNRKDYKGQNYTACRETVWILYTRNHYTSTTVEGVMGLARLVPRATTTCGIPSNYIGIILGIVFGVIALLIIIGVVITVCVVNANQKARKKRLVSPSGIGYPAQNTLSPGFSAAAPPSYGQATSHAAYGVPTQPQAAYGQPAYGQPAYGQPAYGQPAYWQPAHGQDTGMVPSAPVYVAPTNPNRYQDDDVF